MNQNMNYIVTTLKPLTTEMVNNDHLVAVRYCGGKPWGPIPILMPVEINPLPKQPSRSRTLLMAQAHQCRTMCTAKPKSSETARGNGQKELIPWPKIVQIQSESVSGWLYGSKIIHVSTKTQGFHQDNVLQPCSMSITSSVSGFNLVPDCCRYRIDVSQGLKCHRCKCPAAFIYIHMRVRGGQTDNVDDLRCCNTQPPS